MAVLCTTGTEGSARLTNVVPGTGVSLTARRGAERGLPASADAAYLGSGPGAQSFAHPYAMFPIHLADFGVSLMTELYEFLRHAALAIKIQRRGDQLTFVDACALSQCPAALQHIVGEPESGSHPGALHPIEAVRGVALEVRQEPP